MDEFKKYFQDHREDLDTDLPGDELWDGVKKTLHPQPVFYLYKKWIAAACIIIAVGTAAIIYTSKKGTGLAVTTGSGKAAADSGTIKKELQNAPDLIALAKDGSKNVITLPEIKNPLLAKDTGKKNMTITPVIVVGFKAKTETATRTNKVNRMTPPPKKPLYGFEGIEASYTSMLDVQLEQLRLQPIYGEKAEYFDLFKKQFEQLGRDEEKIKKAFREAADKTSMLDELITVYQQKISILKQLQFEINKMNNKVKQTDTGIPMQQPSYIHL